MKRGTLEDDSETARFNALLGVRSRDAMPYGGTTFAETADTDLDSTYAYQSHRVKPGRYVMLSFSDAGCGMDQATVAHIFEPFYTTKEPGKGTGLGLSTVYDIVEQTEGHICVYSELGRGTTFKIYFPQTAQPAQAEPQSNLMGKPYLLQKTISLCESSLCPFFPMQVIESWKRKAVRVH